MDAFSLWQVWEQPETRTFRCPCTGCTGAVVFPVECLDSYLDEKDCTRVGFHGKYTHEDFEKCPVCGQVLGETMAFMKRYGLLGIERPMKPRVDRKKTLAAEPKLPLAEAGFIQVSFDGERQIVTDIPGRNDDAKR